MKSIQRLGILLLLAAGVLTTTQAGMIYKQVDAAGRITYTDLPDSIPAAPPSSLSGPAVMGPRNSAAIDAREAARRLGKAQLQRDEGARIQPGERQKGGDADTLPPRYWQRQERFRLMVEQAQRRSDETRQVLLAGH